MMTTRLELREVVFEDWQTLLDWRNDPLTRENSHNSQEISVEEHQAYLKKLLANPSRTQYLLLIDDIPVGTLREDVLGEGKFELSYIISPAFRGRRLGSLIMSIYLLNRSGTFICEIKKDNISSVKMCLKNGFLLFKEEGEVQTYRLIKDK